MAFDDLDMDTEPEMDAPPPEESSNRAFLVAAGILAAITLLALGCIVIYAVFIRPGQVGQQEVERATLEAQNTQVALAITQTVAQIEAQAAATPTATNTPPPAPPTPTFTPTNTAVVVLPTTAVPTLNPDTATRAALLTQISIVTLTPFPTFTPTGLPTAGFADDVGLPAMMGMAVLLISVIFLARRLRTA